MKNSKFCFLLIFLCLGIFGTININAQTSANVNPTADKDIATVKTFLENLVAGKTEATKMAVNEGMKTYGPGIADSTTIDNMLVAWANNQETFKDMAISWIGGSSTVALRGPFKGTHVYLWGNWSGTDRASGKTATNRFQYTAILHDGKISVGVTHYDALSMFQQLGFTLKEPGNN